MLFPENPPLGMIDTEAAYRSHTLFGKQFALLVHTKVLLLCGICIKWVGYLTVQVGIFSLYYEEGSQGWCICWQGTYAGKIQQIV